MKRVCLFAICALLVSAVSCSRSPLGKKQDGPFETMRQIVLISQSGNYEGLDRYIYNVKLDDGRNSRDMIRNGIVTKIPAGGFAYSDDSYIKAMTDYRKAMHPIDSNVVAVTLMNKMYPFYKDPYIVNLTKTAMNDIMVFADGDAVTVFIKHEGIFKVLFTKEMPSLGKKRFKPKKNKKEEK